MDLNCMKIEIQARHKEKFSNCKNNIWELDYYGKGRISYFYAGQHYRLKDCRVSLMACFL